ncbi:MAG: hypothetical protein EOP08_17290 [Proteobacteria bacterium]|nr:MAG: hypothetical protein EOP08_17290 [Pseudomonadota bacterium]
MPRILPFRLSCFGLCAALAVETTAHAAEPGLSARVTAAKGDRPAQVEWASCAAWRWSVWAFGRARGGPRV